MSTICAISTAPGVGGIAVIRVSGSDTFKICDRIFRPKKAGKSLSTQKAYTLTYGSIVGNNDETIDEVIAAVFCAPHSFTGEDTVEITCHGSTYIQQQILQSLISSGCRIAQPGEYTQRAFMNGKMDLSQAEAVADLIASTSAGQHRLALSQMRGGFSRELAELRNQLLHFTSLMELELDFSDHEELEFADRSELRTLADHIEQVISKLAQSFSVGNAIKNGIPVAIIGETNAGKSTLLNALLNEDKAIVSDIHGTTRDVIEDTININGQLFRFIDTAGIRRKSKVDERVEKFSVMRAQMAIERADVCIIMIDAREGVTEQDTKIAGLAHESGKASIVVVNKWDLVEKETGTMEKMRKEVMRDLSFMSYAPVLFISAKTGQRTDRIFELVNFVNDQSNMRITTGMLNDVLADAQARVQPPTDKGRRLKIYYMTQTGIKPPNFVIFCNSRELFHFSYQRYIENQIRAVFGLEGTPIRMVIRQKGDKQ